MTSNKLRIASFLFYTIVKALNMEEKHGVIDELIEKVEAYGKSSIELFKLKIIEKIAETTSSLVLSTTVIFFGIIFLLFANVGLAFWLGSILNKTYLGFLIVAGFYLLLVLLFSFVFNKGVKKTIENAIVKKMS